MGKQPEIIIERGPDDGGDPAGRAGAVAAVAELTGSALSRSRRGAITLTAATAFLLTLAMAAWACSPNADMTLANSDAPAWDPGSAGLNYSECPIGRYLEHNTGMDLDGSLTVENCTRDVDVTGSDFPANTDVTLYWVDEPFFLTAAGWPGHVGQQVSGAACRELGTSVGSATTNGSGSFTTTVAVPPAGQVAYYGANAICAVWLHDLDSDGVYEPLDGDHYSGFGNEYDIYPL